MINRARAQLLRRQRVRTPFLGAAPQQHLRAPAMSARAAPLRFRPKATRAQPRRFNALLLAAHSRTHAQLQNASPCRCKRDNSQGMADEEFEREKIEPVKQPYHEKQLNAFRNSKEYFTYWLKKLRDT